MAYFVYILQSKQDGTYYIGHTANLRERVVRHNEGRSSYTRNRLPWVLVYHESFETRGEAMSREIEIKSKKNRDSLDQLVRASRV